MSQRFLVPKKDRQKTTYTIRDKFNTALTADNVDGTSADYGPGTRSVTDTESKLSISS